MRSRRGIAGGTRSRHICSHPISSIHRPSYRALYCFSVDHITLNCMVCSCSCALRRWRRRQPNQTTTNDASTLHAHARHATLPYTRMSLPYPHRFVSACVPAVASSLLSVGLNGPQPVQVDSRTQRETKTNNTNNKQTTTARGAPHTHGGERDS